MPRREVEIIALLSALVSALSACQVTPAPPPARMLEPLARVAVHPPETADHLAARIAGASLVGDSELANGLLAELRTELAEAPAPRSPSKPGAEVLERDEGEGALLPLAIDLVNAATDDPREYREASRQLLKRGDLNPAHRARLEQAVADAPLDLASRRVREDYESIFAQVFNTVSAPLGRSLITGGATAPFSLAMSVTHFIARMIERPEVGIRERQALHHWDDFLARHPKAERAPEVRARADGKRLELAEMQCDHLVRSAERALDHGQPRLALVQLERAKTFVPDDPEIAAVSERALAELVRRDELLASSLVASATPPSSEFDRRELLEALWLDPAPLLADQLRRELALLPDDPLADEVDFALATTQVEQGAESASWARLARLADRDPAESNMARYAAALGASPWQNPERAFHRELVAGRQRAVSTQVFGRYAEGPRYRAIPGELSYLIDAPMIAQAALSAPFRWLFSPFLSSGPKRDYKSGAATASYRYLDRFPGGEHSRERIQWLFDYELDRGNALAALRLADSIPDVGVDDRLELAEQAADQQLSGAISAGRRDHRAHMLRGVALAFPDSFAGRDAGKIARHEADRASPQHIRLTRGFLSENPQIAGAFGLGIDPSLTDGDVRNGELHPRGVTFLGGRILEIALLPASGKEEDEPETTRLRISAERLARSVALIEEAATLSVKLDADDSQGVDGSRDQYFERAKLELTGEFDARPTAESVYVYQGLAERYGLVRGRDSILPFDIVVQGSFQDLGIGAFPRWREPALTPDAFLYR